MQVSGCNVSCFKVLLVMILLLKYFESVLTKVFLIIISDILALIMHDLFGGVVYAGIDTDRYKYPIGSGRVTFGNLKSFMKAVKAGFVEIKTPKFTKKVLIDNLVYY